MGDRELLLLLEEKPEAGIHEMMNQFGGAVHTICRNFLYDCSEHDVEEAVADTFIHFWKKRTEFVLDDCYSVRSYLYAIARNAARDKRRKLKRRDIFSLEEISLDMPSAQNVEADFERRKNEQIVHECLKKMKEPDRSIFIYRYFYGFKTKEIAGMMKLTTKKIENILYRGKEKLRISLLEGGISYDE